MSEVPVKASPQRVPSPQPRSHPPSPVRTHAAGVAALSLREPLYTINNGANVKAITICHFNEMNVRECVCVCVDSKALKLFMKLRHLK